MLILNNIVFLENGSVIAPCFEFSLADDLDSSFIMFMKISIRLALVTANVVGYVLYRYFRGSLSWDIHLHLSEIFRCNWFRHHEKVEKKFKISHANRVNDYSTNRFYFYKNQKKGEKRKIKSAEIENEVIDPSSNQSDLNDETTKKMRKKKRKNSNIEMLPRDRFITFPDIFRINFKIYIILCIITFLILFSILVLIVVHFIFSPYQKFSVEYFAGEHMKTLLKIQKSVVYGEKVSHKCVGEYEDILKGYTHAVISPLRLALWDKNVPQLFISIVNNSIMLALLLEFAINSLITSKLKYISPVEKNKKYIYFYNTSFIFLHLFLVFSFLTAGLLVFEMSLRQIN